MQQCNIIISYADITAPVDKCLQHRGLSQQRLGTRLDYTVIMKDFIFVPHFSMRDGTGHPA